MVIGAAADMDERFWESDVRVCEGVKGLLQRMMTAATEDVAA